MVGRGLQGRVPQSSFQEVRPRRHGAHAAGPGLRRSAGMVGNGLLAFYKALGATCHRLVGCMLWAVVGLWSGGMTAMGCDWAVACAARWAGGVWAFPR